MKLTIKLTKIYFNFFLKNQKKYAIVHFCISTTQMPKNMVNYKRSYRKNKTKKLIFSTNDYDKQY